jgi:hypothetical protein
MIAYLRLIVFIILTINCFDLSAQQDSVSTKKIYKLPKSERSLFIAFRFPVGAFGDRFQVNNGYTSGGLVESMEGTSGGMEAGMGYEAGFSSSFFFDKKPSNFNTGLKITPISFSTIPFQWTATNLLKDADYTNLNLLSIKAGLVCRIALREKKSFQFYDQLSYSYGWNGSMVFDEYVNTYYGSASQHQEVNLNSGSGIRNEIGITFRTGSFIADFNFSFGKITFNEVEYINFTSATGYIPYNVNDTYKADMVSSMVNLSVGVGF